MDLDSLRSKIEKLRSMDMDLIRKRSTVIDHRVQLEEKTCAISDATGVDQDVVLAVIGAAWGVHIEAFTDDISADQLSTNVEEDVVSVLRDLIKPDPQLDSRRSRIRYRVVQAFKDKIEPVAVKDVLMQAGRFIPPIAIPS